MRRFVARCDLDRGGFADETTACISSTSAGVMGMFRADPWRCAVPGRPSFIGNIRDGLEPFDDGGSRHGRLRRTRSAGMHGLTRIGINYEITPPGSRSSFPHAEKLEEEFAYVLERQARRLDRRRATSARRRRRRRRSQPVRASPTASSTTSDEDMHLLIARRAPGAGNQLYYPLNPERMAKFTERNRAWLDAPQRPTRPA